MMRILGKSRFCQLALVAVAAGAMVGEDAMAWSYGSWGSSGSYGSYGSSGSSGSYGSSGSHGSYGSHGGGMFSRMRARRAARRASHGSYGSYGSSGSYGSYGSHGSHGGYVVVHSSHGSYGSYGSHGGVSYGTPVNETPTVVVPDEHSSISTGSASIAVTLPEDAKVFVNDRLTTSTGSSRNYVSQGLEAGRGYAYKLRVEFENEGQKVVEQKTLKLRSGDSHSVSFGGMESSQVAAANTPVDTELKLEVPDDAQVYLSGAATKQTGAVRSYVTQRLAAGESWQGYKVRVELERDGQKLVQERTLDVEAGQTYELAFDFAEEEGLKLANLIK